MQTKTNNIKALFGAGLLLLALFEFMQSAVAQTGSDLMVFYGPVVATSTSPKSHVVSYTTNHQIFTMSADGTGVRQLTTGTEDSKFPTWRPGKTHILFHRGSNLYVMDNDGGGSFAVAADRGVGADWSADGKMICYVGNAVSSPGPMGLWIVSVDPSGKANRKVGTPVLVSQGDFYAPVWSRDGTRIAFSDQLEPGNGPHIRVLDLATGAKSTFADMNGLLPSWGPNDEQIAYSGVLASGDWQLFIMNSNFSGNTQVTSLEKPVLWPAWSWDGTQVAFRLGSGQQWDASIYKLTLGNGELSLLHEKGDHPDW